MMMKTAAVAAFAAALALPAAWAAEQPHHRDMKPMMHEMGEKMQSMPMTGDHDVDFAKMMREHHQGGIDMAQWELEHGKDPKIRAMARKIIASQKKEIAEFDQWLERHPAKRHEEQASR